MTERLHATLEGQVNHGRTRRYEYNPNASYLDNASYTSFDLVTAKPREVLTLMTVNPNDRDDTMSFDLVKQQTPRGTSALEGWTLVTEMGETTVRLSLLDRSKGGGPSALHGRVVLREGYELGVSDEAIQKEVPASFGAATPATVHNLGAITRIVDRYRLNEEIVAFESVWEMEAYHHAHGISSI